MALAQKVPSLLALNPDIAVVQECSKKSVDVLSSHDFSGPWFGANPNKGLAVFCSAGFALQAVGKPFGKWVIPVRVNGAIDFNLLAVWACPVGTKRADNYIGQVYRCLVEKSGWFSKPPVVVAGDFKQQFAMGRQPPRTKSHGGSSLIRESCSNQRVPHSPWGAARSRNASDPLLLSPSGQAISHRLRFCPGRLELRIS